MVTKRQENLHASLEALEIGATGPARVQIVFEIGNTNVALGLTATEARWLAGALQHWAEISETIAPSDRH